MTTPGQEILRVRGLEKTFVRRASQGRPASSHKAVDGLSLDLRRGETLGLVGESGCGKSTAARLILRLVEADGGEIRFDGDDVRGLSRVGLRKARRRMQLVFQDPYASLDPRMSVGGVLDECLVVHGVEDRHERAQRVADALKNVGLRQDFAARFPHELSGGQRQRIGIARALILRPLMVIADEPVSALDVSVQAQVLNLLSDVQEQHALSMIFVAHDIAVVEQVSERIAVMFAGRIVESGPTEDLIARPLHPYTKALLSAVLSLDPSARRPRISEERDGAGPAGQGCAYYARCPQREKRCAEAPPPLDSVDQHRSVACHLVTQQSRST
ncbi:MAG: ABC transporter ATP-binding protein [Pseudomonadota bacterium]